MTPGMRVWLNSHVKWNLTSRHKRFAGKQYFFVSIPKSGRTWLRFFLHYYFSQIHGTDAPLHQDDNYPDARPSYYFTHDRYENLIYPGVYDLIRGRYMIPARLRRSAPICLIVRQLPDLMVSLYFQFSKRQVAFEGGLSNFIRHPLFGVANVVGVMNSWVREWQESPNFFVTSYEQWHRDTVVEFGRVVAWLTGQAADERLVAAAVEASSFDRMRRVEASGTERIDALRPGSRHDPESFKTRRGRVGGYVDYMSVDDIAYVERASERLDGRIRRVLASD